MPQIKVSALAEETNKDHFFAFGYKEGNPNESKRFNLGNITGGASLPKTLYVDTTYTGTDGENNTYSALQAAIDSIGAEVARIIVAPNQYMYGGGNDIEINKPVIIESLDSLVVGGIGSTIGRVNISANCSISGFILDYVTVSPNITATINNCQFLQMIYAQEGSFININNCINANPSRGIDVIDQGLGQSTYIYATNVRRMSIRGNNTVLIAENCSFDRNFTFDAVLGTGVTLENSPYSMFRNCSFGGYIDGDTELKPVKVIYTKNQDGGAPAIFINCQTNEYILSSVNMIVSEDYCGYTPSNYPLENGYKITSHFNAIDMALGYLVLDPQFYPFYPVGDPKRLSNHIIGISQKFVDLEQQIQQIRMQMGL